MSKRVLIVEDDTELQELYKESLADFNVIVCNDGIEGMNQFLEYDDWDLIIMDIRLPRMTGEKCVEVIRHSGEEQPTPILVISGFITERLHSKLMSFERLSILEKPFKYEKFMASVENLIAGKE